MSLQVRLMLHSCCTEPRRSHRQCSGSSCSSTKPHSSTGRHDWPAVRRGRFQALILALAAAAASYASSRSDSRLASALQTVCHQPNVQVLMPAGRLLRSIVQRMI